MQINNHTKIYGLFGYPVRHALSPVMHNAAFKKIGLNAVYLSFEVKPEKIKDAIKAVRTLGISGLNLTVPHKESCIRYLDKLSPQAKLIGAVNTVVLREGKLVGYNTDGDGFVTSLKIDAHINPKGKSIFILGAGGAARAVAFILAKEGAKKISVTDLIVGRALSLASNIRMNFSTCDIKAVRVGSVTKILKYIDILINATTVGLKRDDPLIIDPDSLHSKLVVCDLIYNPLQTKLLECAKRKNLTSINGLGMLLYQGAISFELWTQEKAPIEVMRLALLKNIKM